MALQQFAPKVRGVADIIFVIDRSGSMSGVIEALKQHLDSFLAGISTGQQKIDVRMGMVFHPDILKVPLTPDINVVRTALSSVSTAGDECTLPAIDAALHMDWRPNSRRLLAVFTDEDCAGGARPEWQAQNAPKLMGKISTLRVKGFLIGPPCPVHDSIGRLPGWVRIHMDGSGLATMDMAALLREMGRTVTTLAQEAVDTTPLAAIY